MANENSAPTIFTIPDQSGSGSGSIGELALLSSMLNNNNGLGNGGLLWVIFLFFLFPLLRNGGLYGGNQGGGNGSTAGWGYLGNLVNNNDGRDMLMQAINRNDSATQNLANMFQTSTGNILQALNTAQNAIQQVGNTVGMSTQQIINSVERGNDAIVQQMCNQFCNIRESITRGNYENQIATQNQTYQLGSQINQFANDVAKSFSDSAYRMAEQSCAIKQTVLDQTQELKDATNQQTTAIIAKLDGMEKAALQDKIASQTAQNAALQTQLNLEHQNATQAANTAAQLQPLANGLASVNAKLAEIESKQQSVVTLPYNPYTVIPNYGYPSYGGAWT